MIKKLIISEKIVPYQLKLEKSSSPFSNLSKSSTNSSTRSTLLLNFKTSSSSSSSSSSNCFDNDEYYKERNDEEDDNRRLTEEDIEFLLANTGFTTTQINRWHDEFKLKCSTCRIEYNQFKHYYKSLLPGYLRSSARDELIKKLFRLFDIDADGYLNFAEFLVSFWIRFRAPVNEKFTWLFNMFDEDRNGSLSHAEMTKALARCLNVSDLEKLLSKLSREVSDAERSSDDSSTINDYDSELFEYVSGNSKIEERLNKLLYLLDEVGKRECKSNEDENENDSWSIGSSSRTEMGGGDDSSSFSITCNKQHTTKRVCFTRDRFLHLCQKYELLRKMLLPIKCFYQDPYSSSI